MSAGVMVDLPVQTPQSASQRPFCVHGSIDVTPASLAAKAAMLQLQSARPPSSSCAGSATSSFSDMTQLQADSTCSRMSIDSQPAARRRPPQTSFPGHSTQSAQALHTSAVHRTPFPSSAYVNAACPALFSSPKPNALPSPSALLLRRAAAAGPGTPSIPPLPRSTASRQQHL